MSCYKKLIIAFSLTFIVTNAGATSQFPRGCEVTGFRYNNNFLILNERGEQAYFLLQNRSNKPVELEVHESKDVFMSPKLHSKVEPLQWSAFASDIENQAFKCSIQEGEDTKIINCGDVLEVCQYPRVRFALSNMGNYWVSTSKEQGQVIKDTVAKGIWLRW